MNWLMSLFGGADTASKTLDLVSSSVKGIGSFIDEQQFTPEERSQANMKAVEAHLELIKATTGENSTRSVTRRWLAWGVTGYVVIWGSLAMVFAILGKSNVVNDMVAVINALNLGITFLAIMGFYFGVSLLRK